MSDQSERSATELVEEYLDADIPSRELLEEIVRQREAAIPLLIEVLLTRPPDKEPDDARTYPDMRASWLLFHLRPPEALPAFERVMLDPDRDDLSPSFERDLLVYGPAAFSVLCSVLRAETAPLETREAVARDIARLGATHPEVREEAVEVLREMFAKMVPTGGERERVRLAGECAMALLMLRDEFSVPRIREIERAGGFRRDREMRDLVREWLRGWRTFSAKRMAPVEFDLIETYDQFLWIVPDEDEEMTTCPVCGKPVPLDPDHESEKEPHDPIRREAPKTGRNDPCPCGSGKKYKRCCGR